MDPKQYRRWDQYYLFQESLGKIVNIQSIMRDLSDESDSQMTSVSHQTPMGSQSNLAGAAKSGASGTVLPEASQAPEEEWPKRKPHCAFQWEKKRLIQYPVEGEPHYLNWARSRPTWIPDNH